MQDENFQLERRHLEWPDPGAGETIERHRKAWDRLRLVCRELGCTVPSMDEVEAMSQLPPSFVLAADVDTGKPHLVNFDIGYRQSNNAHAA
jgi:hypothetical protein